MLNKLQYQKKYFENKAWFNNMYTCGIDEVGRGCLAGPLVVGAVILPLNCNYELLKDSKILTEKDRNKASNWIIKNCYYTTVTINNKQIDKINIPKATLIATKKAFIEILYLIPFKNENIQYLLIDAMPLKIDSCYKHKKLEIKHFPKGETISPSIAAASIIAKVARDNLMKKMHNYFPHYYFWQNKGYGTQKHIEVIKKQKSIIHRQSFLNFLKGEKKNAKQTSIF